jgi:hypothetical protein
MNEGREILAKALEELEKKTSKKARKQAENIRRHIKENKIESVSGLIPLPTIKQKVKNYIVLLYQDFDLNEKIYRYVNDDDSTINLSKKPMMVVVKNIESKFLKEAEQLETHCLVYDFQYVMSKFHLLLSCNSCYFAFKYNNRFCELMNKAIYECGLGFFPRLYNPEWEDAPKIPKEERDLEECMK